MKIRRTDAATAMRCYFAAQQWWEEEAGWMQMFAAQAWHWTKSRRCRRDGSPPSYRNDFVLQESVGAQGASSGGYRDLSSRTFSTDSSRWL
jgi:hypothetical protein